VPVSRPLIVSDCDEVLLYMVSHFRDWLGEEQGIDFDMGGSNFATAMRYRDSGEAVGEEDIWRFLNLFFDGQMHRQLPVEGAVEAIAELTHHADVVVLTNLKDFRQEARARQLAEHGIELKVYTNQGPKGPALRAILDEYRPSRAIFIDDLAQHHDSVSTVAPHTARLHLCAEPSIAPHIACAHAAGHAHARIDDWASALPWLLDQLDADEAA
jgi:FMN phosphatase YigB (HAD superfamily)